jgi:hypothetical protein
LIEDKRGRRQAEVLFVMKHMTYGTPLDPSLFRLPSDQMTEAKELSKWNAAKDQEATGG